MAISFCLQLQWWWDRLIGVEQKASHFFLTLMKPILNLWRAECEGTIMSEYGKFAPWGIPSPVRWLHITCASQCRHVNHKTEDKLTCLTVGSWTLMHFKFNCIQICLEDFFCCIHTINLTLNLTHLHIFVVRDMLLNLWSNPQTNPGLNNQLRSLFWCIHICFRTNQITQDEFYSFGFKFSMNKTQRLNDF